MASTEHTSPATPERILRVAEEEFALRGFAGARMQEIGRRSGVTKAMIHYYFASKERLYHSVLDRVFSDLVEMISHVLATPRSYGEGAELIFRGFFDFVIRHPSFSRLSTMAVGSPDDYFGRKVEQVFTPLFERAIRFIEGGIEAGVFRPIDARSFLMAMYGMTITGFSDAHFLGLLTGEDPSAEEAARRRLDCLVDILLTTLGVHAAS